MTTITIIISEIYLINILKLPLNPMIIQASIEIQQKLFYNKKHCKLFHDRNELQSVIKHIYQNFYSVQWSPDIVI